MSGFDKTALHDTVYQTVFNKPFVTCKVLE